MVGPEIVPPGRNVVFLKMASHADIRVIHALYCQPAARINGLRKDLVQQISDCLGIHRRSRHARPPSPAYPATLGHSLQDIQVNRGFQALP